MNKATGKNEIEERAEWEAHLRQRLHSSTPAQPAEQPKAEQPDSVHLAAPSASAAPEIEADVTLKNAHTLADFVHRSDDGPIEALHMAIDMRAAAPSPAPANLTDVAIALEQQRALKIVDDVHNLRIGGRTEVMPTEFQAGHCGACEEIEHRRWPLPLA